MQLTQLKGIGKKTEELLEKAGIHDVMDLLFLFPRDYEVFYPPLTIGEIGYKTFATIRGVFTQEITERRVKKLSISQGVFQDEAGGSVRVVWFNAPFIKNTVKTGVPYVLRGRVSRKYQARQIDQPRLYSLAEYDLLEGNLQPIYPLTKGVSNQLITKCVRQALQTEAFARIDEQDFIPESVRREYGLMLRSSAVRNLHFPEDKEAYQKAVQRMSFEEIFLFIYLMKRSGTHTKEQTTLRIPADPRTRAFLKGLPFELTDAQKKVIKELQTDLDSGHVTSRLIQGDVGSGKTLVALASLMDAAFAGYQTALMAPTEVLAAQHYETIQKLFREQKTGLNAALLTGSMTALEKKAVYNALEDGRIDILIGTHALIQEKVHFSNLALVVTDEQHRFGIRQREALAAKGGSTPHMIVMSATPIPRTLALILYGDMDVSVIDELPARRLPIKNAVVDDSFHENAYRFITNQVKAGHQAYIICPLVEYSEGLDAANVEDYTEMLRQALDPSIRIGKLTGPMPPAKKNEIMTKFSNGEIDVLVSTTVVEVGVDVPNATVMMVEDANRFGLATLHQLRGRVGRGADQSYCIFVSNNRSPEAMERLGILKSSNNGFEIAAKDLEMRGPGELMGVKQSGALSFANFDLYRDGQIASEAAEAVDRILSGSLPLTQWEKDALQQQCESSRNTILL
ncbi:MAG: ATP-dependent DNA helicase RecG [Parasporobacterium sp.]|nr:ATP-dependent DNA helicase RecG [Parasporobacterium sp.]